MKEFKFIKESIYESPDNIINENLNETEDALTIRSLPAEICANAVCQTQETASVTPEVAAEVTTVVVTNDTDENGEKFSDHVRVLKGTLDNELAKPEDARYFIRFKIKEKGKSDKTLPVYKGIPVSKATETNYVFKTGKKEIKVFDLKDMILEGCGGNPNFHVNPEDKKLEEVIHTNRDRSLRGKYDNIKNMILDKFREEEFTIHEMEVFIEDAKIIINSRKYNNESILYLAIQYYPYKHGKKDSVIVYNITKDQYDSHYDYIDNVGAYILGSIASMINPNTKYAREKPKMFNGTNSKIIGENLDEDAELVNKSAKQRQRQRELLNKSAALKNKSSKLSDKTKLHLSEEEDEDSDINELDDATVDSAIDKMRGLGQNARATRLSQQQLDSKLSQFYDTPFVLGNSDEQMIINGANIRLNRMNEQELQLSYSSLRSREYNRTSGSIIYNIDRDKYEGLFKVDLKTAKLFAKIAVTINPNTKYKDKNMFQIKGLH